MNIHEEYRKAERAAFLAAAIDQAEGPEDMLRRQKIYGEMMDKANAELWKRMDEERRRA